MEIPLEFECNSKIITLIIIPPIMRKSSWHSALAEIAPCKILVTLHCLTELSYFSYSQKVKHSPVYDKVACHQSALARGWSSSSRFDTAWSSQSRVLSRRNRPRGPTSGERASISSMPENVSIWDQPPPNVIVAKLNEKALFSVPCLSDWTSRPGHCKSSPGIPVWQRTAARHTPSSRGSRARPCHTCPCWSARSDLWSTLLLIIIIFFRNQKYIRANSFVLCVLNTAQKLNLSPSKTWIFVVGARFRMTHSARKWSNKGECSSMRSFSFRCRFLTHLSVLNQYFRSKAFLNYDYPLFNWLTCPPDLHWCARFVWDGCRELEDGSSTGAPWEARVPSSKMWWVPVSLPFSLYCSPEPRWGWMLMPSCFTVLDNSPWTAEAMV